MTNWRDDYWAEALSLALEAEGIEMSVANIRKLGAALAVSAENEGMCHPPVSNPLAGEIEALKRQHAAEMARQEKRFGTLLNEACRALRVDPSRVEVRANDVIVHRA